MSNKEDKEETVEDSSVWNAIQTFVTFVCVSGMPLTKEEEEEEKLLKSKKQQFGS